MKWISVVTMAATFLTQSCATTKVVDLVNSGRVSHQVTAVDAVFVHEGDEYGESEIIKIMATGIEQSPEVANCLYNRGNLSLADVKRGKIPTFDFCNPRNPPMKSAMISEIPISGGIYLSHERLFLLNPVLNKLRYMENIPVGNSVLSVFATKDGHAVLFRTKTYDGIYCYNDETGGWTYSCEPHMSRSQFTIELKPFNLQKKGLILVVDKNKMIKKMYTVDSAMLGWPVQISELQKRRKYYGYYSLVPIAVLFDVVTYPLQMIGDCLGALAALKSFS